MLKVAKFGGSSLADSGQFKKVRDIVHADPSRRLVVVSAPGKRNQKDQKVTDLLYDCAEKRSQGVDMEPSFRRFSRRFLDIKKNLLLGTDLGSMLQDIKEMILRGASADYCASRGEYLCALLMAEYLGYDFLDAAEIFCFDDRGKFLEEASLQRIRQRVQGEKMVIPGFYGSDKHGGIHTFSRGGSDFTGAIMARAVGASLYENWTDVSGFMRIDPQLVGESKPIAQISYQEMRELAYMGAPIMHEEAVFPVREAGIPIHIRNTNEPEARGTLIVKDCDETIRGSITGIAGKRDFTVLSLEKTKMRSQQDFFLHLLEILSSQGLRVEHMPSSIDSISVLLRSDSWRRKGNDTLAIIHERLQPDHVEISERIALLCVVGRGMKRQAGTSAKIFSALAEREINIRMISQGSGEINIIIGLEEEDLEEAMKAIDEAFGGIYEEKI